MAITLTKKNRTFSDLNLLFAANPITGDVSRKYDEDAVKASVKHLVLTKPYESPFHPEISCQANTLLFELASPVTAELIRTTITQVLTKFEPRISAFEVQVDDDPDANAYSITVYFQITGSDKTITVSTLLYRSR